MYNYVVDTGVRITHNEFQGRATWGTNIVNDNDSDNAGHGTHVSGVIGGVTYGVAKQTNMIAVKVFEGNSVRLQPDPKGSTASDSVIRAPCPM